MVVHALPEPHEAASQTQLPPAHVEPLGHAAAPPQAHAPLALHASPDGKPPAVTQLTQVAPPVPHWLALVLVTHVALSAQQPLHDPGVQAHAPSTQASPLGQIVPPGPHEHWPLTQRSAVPATHATQ